MRFISTKNMEIKADQDAMTFSGYASVSDIEDDGEDILKSGAWKKGLKSNEGRIKALYQHDPMQPIGRPILLEEDDHGLKFKVQLSDTPLARDVMAHINNKVLTEMSVGFEDKASKPRGENKGREISEALLWEISPVTWGMNSSALIALRRRFGRKQCGCTCQDNDTKGEALGAALTSALNAAVGEDGDRDAVVAEMAEAASMEVEEVEAVLDGSADPTLAQLEAFAEVLGADLEELLAAAEEDGLDLFGDDDSSDGDEPTDEELAMARSIIAKAGRVLSAKNHGKISEAQALLKSVLASMDASPPKAPEKSLSESLDEKLQELHDNTEMGRELASMSASFSSMLANADAFLREDDA